MRRTRAASAAALVAIWGGVSAWLALDLTSRVHDWALQNDELLYEKLALAVATTHSPVPQLHGTFVAVLNQLYPVLIAPFFGAYSTPDAFHAAHVLGAPLMASAAIPAYLLARRVVGRPWSLAVALLTAVVPWLVISGALLTEVAAYPAFLWAVLGLERTVERPGLRADLLAAGSLVLAVLARTQFVFLVAVLPIAIVVHEVGSATAEPGRLARGARSAVARHRPLAWLYVAGAIAAGVVAAFGALGNLLGTYAVTAHGSPLPGAVWRAIATHVDTVALGSGLVPVVLGGGWLLAAVGRPRDSASHAFATLALLATASLLVEASSYDVRFGGPHDVHDRYLFYVVPLLLVGMAAALAEGHLRSTAVAAGGFAVAFAATAPLLDFATPPGYLVDSPGRILNRVLTEQAGSLGTGTFVALAGLCVGLAAAAGLLVLPRRPFAAAVLAFLLPFLVLATRAEIGRAVASFGPSGRPFAKPPGTVLDWIDRTLPAGAQTAIVPFPLSAEFALSATAWWDAEFWNRSVVRTFVAADGTFSYAPFPNRTLAPDWETGVAAGTERAPAYVVFALNDPRFRLVGPRHAENLGLRVITAERPYRAHWATRGLDTDGWLLADRPATLRLYSTATAARLVRVRISFGAAPAAPAAFSLAWASGRRDGGAPMNGVATEQIPVCVPAGGHADVTLTGRSSTGLAPAPTAFVVPGSRRVSAHVGPIAVDATGPTCRS